MANPLLSVTHTSEVTEDQIDELGHMNVRWYARHALAATSAMTERLGVGAPRCRSAYTRHHREQLVGAVLEVRSGVLGGASRLRLYHELRNVADGVLAATFVHELDHPPVETPAVDLPEHGRPRSIALDTDALASAPTLDEALRAGLAIRRPRAVDDGDTAGRAVVAPWRAQGLFWDGATIDGASAWLRVGPDGRRLASATMESRVWFGTMPAHGTPIQSFGVPVELADKVTRHIHWVFDLDGGALLAAMETVNIVFDIDGRRAIPIPDSERAETEARLRPDLAPR